MARLRVQIATYQKVRLLRYPIEERQARASKLIRHFNDHAFESFRDFGEMLSIAHGLVAKNPWAQQPASMNKISVDRYLWRHGLNAEDNNPIRHPSKKAFLDAVRNKLSDWADFDVAAAHHSYGYDYLCTDDQDRQPSNIFGAQHANDVVNLFGVRTIRLMELGKECWKRFKFPILKWHDD